MTTKPSDPFSNGSEFEFFLGSFCDRCTKHDLCPIIIAIFDAQFHESEWPANDIVSLYKDGAEFPKYYHVCTHFASDDADVMESYHVLFEG